jgi:hypothetical protein
LSCGQGKRKNSLSAHFFFHSMNYDEADVKEVSEWISGLLGEECPEFPDGFKSGVVLCKLANVLKPGIVKKINGAKLPFHKMENIQNFTIAARELGVIDRNNFVTVDLYEENDLKAVLKTLLNLKRDLGYGINEKKPQGDVFDRI